MLKPTKIWLKRRGFGRDNAWYGHLKLWIKTKQDTWTMPNGQRKHQYLGQYIGRPWVCDWPIIIVNWHGSPTHIVFHWYYRFCSEDYGSKIFKPAKLGSMNKLLAWMAWWCRFGFSMRLQSVNLHKTHMIIITRRMISSDIVILNYASFSR